MMKPSRFAGQRSQPARFHRQGQALRFLGKIILARGSGIFPKNDAEEKHSIIQALKTSHGSRKQAAGILHIDPSTLYRKMKKYGLNDK